MPEQACSNARANPVLIGRELSQKQGAAGKRLTVNLTKRDLSRLVRRYVEWRNKKYPPKKPKPRFVKYWRTR